AKGIEPQTLKLFEVCRDRGLPLLSFLNKYDRPGRPALELLDEIEQQIGLVPTPVTWPVGIPGDFRGVLDRRAHHFVRFTRTAGGATEAIEEIVDPARAAEEEGDAWSVAQEELALLDAVGADFDAESFLDGTTTPVFSGFVFKVQANMDPAHRDRIAFVRVCSGRFERGMVVTHDRTGKPFATKYAHSVFGQERETVEEAYPGDVVGLVNASDVRVGDSLWVDEKVTYPSIPSFAPEHFAVARVRDTGRFKQFRKGIAQLDEEGVVQVLRDDAMGDQAPVLAAVGPMQFEVAVHRLENEFGAPVELSTTGYKVARRTDQSSAGPLRAMSGVTVLERSDGTLLALFESPYWLQRVETEQPGLRLERLVAEG